MIKNLTSAHFEVPYSGPDDSIATFYELLGLKYANGAIRFAQFEVFFGGIFDGPICQFVIETNKNPGFIETELIKQGRKILESGFDISGPFLIVEDPAGLRVRIGYTLAALASASI